MCVLIHKPAGIAVSERIIRSAALHNADGWGVMSHTANGDTVLERHVDVDATRTIDFLRAHTDSELAIHLRRRTHGDVNACNAHPFEIEPGLYLMHNGSFTLPIRDPMYSDTWHLVHDILRPLARRHRDLITDPTFLQLISAVAGPDNRLILFDAKRAKFHVVNRQIGVDHAGLWIGSLKWLDAGLFEGAVVECAARRPISAKSTESNILPRSPRTQAWSAAENQSDNMRLLASEIWQRKTSGLKANSL